MKERERDKEKEHKKREGGEKRKKKEPLKQRFQTVSKGQKQTFSLNKVLALQISSCDLVQRVLLLHQ